MYDLQFSETAIFEKIVNFEFRFFKYVNFLSVFQCGAPSCSHADNEFVQNLVIEKQS